MENPQSTIKRNTPRDVFLHFLAIITLYWSAVGFIALMWQFINYFLPDRLAYQYLTDYYLGPMRFAVASLIIVFPVFVFVSWYLNRNYLKNPEIREMRLRKWLIYFTLFVAALIIIGDLVRVILVFLEGDITLRFVLKAGSVLLTAAAIFGYYLDDVRKDKPAKMAKYFAWSTSTIVLIAIVGSFFVIGSPAKERLKRFDQQKISDLQTIQSQIVNHWQRKEQLPLKLSDLQDTISGFRVPMDPETGASYEYNIKDQVALTFELCAVFNREGKDINRYYEPAPVLEPVKGGQYSNWDHVAGRVCFERNIDKELYPPINKIKD